MSSTISQLKKLRGRSIDEIADRSRQHASKLGERLLGFGTSEMSDARLLGEIHPDFKNGNGEGSAMLIVDRIRRAIISSGLEARPLPFFSVLQSRDEACSILKDRFSSECQSIIQRAERAIAGRFDFLGFDEITYGDPIDWHLEPISGKRAPLWHWSLIDYLNPEVAGDKKLIWEVNRHGHFVTLGQAYWITRDECFAEAFVAQAESWMNANPPKRGINWASSLELSFRVIAWLWALHLFAESDRLTRGFVARFFKYLIAQGRHIEAYLSHYFSPNTHLTGEALGLFYLGATLPELTRARRWRQTGLRVLVSQLRAHFRDDGTYFEQSSYYHRYTADFFLHLMAFERLTENEIEETSKSRIASAIDHLSAITRPDGTTPFYGDDDGGRLISFHRRSTNDFRDTLAIAAALFNREDWKFVAGEAPVEVLWMLGPAALAQYDALRAVEPRTNSRAFVDGGYFVMRDGWSSNSSFALIDCGPHGWRNGGHAHADALSLEFAGGGSRWIIDPGSFSYTGDSTLRNSFRSTAAHNTVTIDGLSQSVPAGPFSWKRGATAKPERFIVDESFDYFEGSHDGYKRLADRVLHTRSILFLKDRDGSEPSLLAVYDQFGAERTHQYVARYHLAPECAAERVENGVVARDKNGHSLMIAGFSASGAVKGRIERGLVSQCYAQKEQASVVEFEVVEKGHQQLVSLIVPQPRDQQPSIIASRVMAVRKIDSDESSSGYVYSIKHSVFDDLIFFSPFSAEFELNPFSGNCRTAWCRFQNDEFYRCCAVDGTRIAAMSRFALASPTQFSHCAVSINDARMEITIEGTTRFDLCLEIPQLNEIVVNNRTFGVEPRSSSAQFICEQSNWHLTDN